MSQCQSAFAIAIGIKSMRSDVPHLLSMGSGIDPILSSVAPIALPRSRWPHLGTQHVDDSTKWEALQHDCFILVCQVWSSFGSTTWKPPGTMEKNQHTIVIFICIHSLYTKSQWLHITSQHNYHFC